MPFSITMTSSPFQIRL